MVDRRKGDRWCQEEVVTPVKLAESAPKVVPAPMTAHIHSSTGGFTQCFEEKGRQLETFGLGTGFAGVGEGCRNLAEIHLEITAREGRQTYNPSMRGVLASLLCHCRDVGEALQVFQHHIALMNPSERWLSSIRGGSLVLTISFAPDRAYPRPALERSMSALVTWIAEQTGIHVTPAACGFAFPRPSYHGRYAEVFGNALSFGGDISCMHLPSEVLYRPIRGANSYLKQVLQERAQQALQRIEIENVFVGKVRQRIRLSLHRGLGIGDVCNALHVSRPTLYSRLKREGTSYTELLAVVRKELAYQQIEQGRPVVCISDNLGFKDVSSFHRAFRRWFKQSPGALRARLRVQRNGASQ